MLRDNHVTQKNPFFPDIYKTINVFFAIFLCKVFSIRFLPLIFICSFRGV